MHKMANWAFHDWLAYQYDNFKDKMVENCEKIRIKVMQGMYTYKPILLTKSSNDH